MEYTLDDICVGDTVYFQPERYQEEYVGVVDAIISEGLSITYYRASVGKFWTNKHFRYPWGYWFRRAVNPLEVY